MSNAIVALGVAVLALASVFGAVKGWRQAPRWRSPHRFGALPLPLRIFIVVMCGVGLVAGILLAQEVGSARNR